MYRLAGHTISDVEMAVAALIVALLAVMPSRVWRGARLGVTAVHESGHAIAALLVGRKVTAIHLRPDTSGVTIHYGRGGRIRRAVTAAAGYPAPGVLALGGAFLVEYREPQIWLAALLALGVVNVVLWIRNLFGFVVMAAWIGGGGWLILRGTAGGDALVSSVAVWFLVLGGLRAASEVPRAPGASDAADLGKLLHLPSGLCKVGFVVVSATAVVAVATVLATTPR
jgi:Peptidase M50B-like